MSNRNDNKKTLIREILAESNVLVEKCRVSLKQQLESSGKALHILVAKKRDNELKSNSCSVTTGILIFVHC